MLVTWELHRPTPNTGHSWLSVTQFAVSGAPSRPEGCGLLANEVPGQFERKITTQVPISDEALRAADHPARLAERL